jgi:hypothetical protein
MTPMLAVGSVLIGFMVLALGILTPAFRDPDGRRWINRPLVGELVTVVLVGVLTLGLGFIGAGIMSEYAHGLDPIDIGLLLAVAVGTVVLWRRLNLGHRVDVVEERSATASVSHLMGQGRDGPPPVRPTSTP